jgi:signal transduction histidine kinase
LKKLGGASAVFLLTFFFLKVKILPRKGVIFLNNDGKIREELLAKIKDLEARLEETEEALRTASKNKNNHERKHAEEEIRWAKERNNDRAKADVMLQFEKNEHRRSAEELGKTQEQLRDVSFKLLLAEETERKRIAQEIHDGIAQYWIVVKNRVENILKQLGKEIATPLEDILPVIKVGMEETRRIQMNLRPALLDDLGILATLSWVCREFQKAHPDIRIETEINIQEDDVPNPIKTVIYRVMQEALNNVSKHSQANLVNLTLRKKDDQIDFIIQDQGQGFDLNAGFSLMSSDKGLGLAGMKERTHLSGGSFSIESSKGQGTTIQASWPVSVDLG